MKSPNQTLERPPGLRRSGLGVIAVLGQSVATIAPVSTPALAIALVAGKAGNATWLTYGFATISIIFIALNIASLARRHPQAGSYFVYIGRTLGPWPGIVAGLSIFAAYVAFAIGSVFGAYLFADYILTAVGLATALPTEWVFVLGFVTLAWAVAYIDIRFSSRITMIIEAGAVCIIGLITAWVVILRGIPIDPVQLDIQGKLNWGFVSGLALALSSFVGFESAATLAKEAHDPTRSVPRAIVLGAALSGLFFTTIAYLIIFGVGDVSVIANNPSPFAEVASHAGSVWVAIVVYIAAFIGSFACALAFINAISRVLFSLARYGFVSVRLSIVHPKHGTPYVAISVVAFFVALICLALSDFDPLIAAGLAATFGTFGFLVIYLLISFVSSIDLYRAGLLRLRHVLISIGGVLVMVFAISTTIYPVPTFPYDAVPYVFFGYLMLSLPWYAVLRERVPDVLRALNEDREG